MKIKSKNFSSIWYDQETKTISYIDQTALPWELKIKQLRTREDTIRAINDMEVRGAPLIGVTAAFGFYLGMKEARSRAENFQPQMILQQLLNTRPTAVNLKWALDQMSSPFGSAQGPATSCQPLSGSALLSLAARDHRPSAPLRDRVPLLIIRSSRSLSVVEGCSITSYYR